MNRETPRQLMIRMMHAQDIVPPGRFIRHVRTGGEYIVKGHSLRVGDLAPMVEYSPLFGPVIVFSRNAHDIRRKFVLMGADYWPEQPFTAKENK